MLCPVVWSEMTEHCIASLKAKAGTDTYLQVTGEDHSRNYANEGILRASAPRLDETVAAPIECWACLGGCIERIVVAAQVRMSVETTSGVFEPGLGASWLVWVTEGHAEVRRRGRTHCEDSRRCADAVQG